MGLLDSLFGGGVLPPWLGGPQQQQQQQQAQAQPPQVGLLDRLVAGFQGAANSESPMAALGNLVGGVSLGQRTDPAGAQQAGVTGMLNELVARGSISPTQARFLAANPKSWEELSKAMIAQPITVAPSGDILVTRPFGQVNIPGAVPISNDIQVTNADGTRSPAFATRPSLARPGGNITIPQVSSAQSAAPAPQPAPAIPGAPGAPNPNLPNGGRIITEASPQVTNERQGVGTALAEEYRGITTKAAAATRQLATLRRMSQLSPDAFEGAAAPGMQFARSLLTSIGIPSRTVAAGEEFTALQNKLTLDANNGSLGTGVSNADVQFLSNINPNLSQSAQGRMQIIEVASRLARRDQDIAREAQRYRSINGGSLDGFQVHISDWANRNPLFADLAQPRPQSQPQGNVATPGGPGYRIIGIR